MKKLNWQIVFDLAHGRFTNLRKSIKKSFTRSNLSIIVLDDDPTGTQTVHDVPVLTEWSKNIIATEFRNETSLFFLLTNSRSLSEEDAILINAQIAQDIISASEETDRKFIVISRSDSTLRGHFPAETDTLSRHLFNQKPILFFIPAFYQGGRVTISGNHYVLEKDEYIPASKTPFAKDPAFGFTTSNLPLYIEEKTNGSFPANKVISISLDDLRNKGYKKAWSIVRSASSGAIIIPDAVNRNDLEIFAAGFWKWFQPGSPVLFRSAASIVPVLVGQKEKRLLDGQNISGSGNGILVVAGSYVPKTTSQLNHLFETHRPVEVELAVETLLEKDFDPISTSLANQVNEALMQDKTVVLYTSRKLIKANEKNESLSIVNRVSKALIQTVDRIKVRPKALIAKGGITSSDVATKALRVKRATVKGQILPGVPVWTLGEESRFPGMNYIIFPGNVGDDDAISTVVTKISKMHNN